MMKIYLSFVNVNGSLLISFLVVCGENVCNKVHIYLDFPILYTVKFDKLVFPNISKHLVTNDNLGPIELFYKHQN